jgi:hypothetical protein
MAAGGKRNDPPPDKLPPSQPEGRQTRANSLSYTRNRRHCLTPMTTEERFARIEHVTAALAEERRKDREEDRQLWRDTQRQINETNAAIAKFAEQSQAADQELRDRMAALAAQSHAETERAKAAEDELRNRIASLVSAIGLYLSRLPPPTTPA